VSASEGALHRAATDPAGGDQRSIYIEQQHRGAGHAGFLVDKIDRCIERFAAGRVLPGMKRLLGGLRQLGLAALVLAGTGRAWAADGATTSGTGAAPAAKGNIKIAVEPVPDPYRDSPPLLLGGGRNPKLGGYAGLGGGYTPFLGRDSGFVSLEGALLLDHRLSIGVAGYGFTRTPSGPRTSDGERQEFGAGYGGLAVRYSVFGGFPVYATFGTVLGAGAVNLHRDLVWDDEEEWDDGLDHDDDEWRSGKFDPFLFIQPELALNANLTRWLRAGATVGYRFTGGVGRFGLVESDLNGVVAGANLQVGWF
jgi:hypothetical protein